MAIVDVLYEWLSTGPTPECDHILGAALERAETPDHERISEILFSRANIAAWGALIGQYDRLDVTHRVALQSDDHLWRSGISGAFKHTSVTARCAALNALAERPSIKLAYLIPHALRDPAARVRDVAVQAFRRIADQAWNSTEAHGDDAAGREVAADRAQFVQTLQGLLRTYDRHHRVEIIEVCLWFADELGGTFWEALENTRTRLSRVVEEHLDRWSGPRLIRFLLLALTRSDWRLSALRLLRTLQGGETGIALLRSAALLDNPEIGRAIVKINKTNWYEYFDGSMSRIPVALRLSAPAFIARCGLDQSDKLALLTEWLRGSDAAIRRATVYALSEMDLPAAQSALEEISGVKNADGAFARWYLAGRRGAVRKDVSSIPSSAPARPMPQQVTAAPVDPSLKPGDFWQACRKASGPSRYDAIELIRNNIGEWVDRISMYSRSPDAADRLLVLQICERADLLARFAPDLQPLLTDATPVVRNLATRILKQSQPVTTS